MEHREFIERINKIERLGVEARMYIEQGNHEEKCAIYHKIAELCKDLSTDKVREVSARVAMLCWYINEWKANVDKFTV